VTHSDSKAEVAEIVAEIDALRRALGWRVRYLERRIRLIDQGVDLGDPNYDDGDYVPLGQPITDLPF